MRQILGSFAALAPGHVEVMQIVDHAGRQDAVRPDEWLCRSSYGRGLAGGMRGRAGNDRRRCPASRAQGVLTARCRRCRIHCSALRGLDLALGRQVLGMRPTGAWALDVQLPHARNGASRRPRRAPWLGHIDSLSTVIQPHECRAGASGRSRHILFSMQSAAWGEPGGFGCVICRNSANARTALRWPAVQRSGQGLPQALAAPPGQIRPSPSDCATPKQPAAVANPKRRATVRIATRR
jgi:hypothetical protein